MLMRKIVFVTAICLIEGCSSTFPYAPAGFRSPGYQDKNLGDNIHEISVFGKKNSGIETLVYYFHRRADELCKGSAYIVLETEQNESITIAGCSSASPPPVPMYDGKIKCI